MPNASVTYARIFVLCSILLSAGCTRETTVMRYTRFYTLTERAQIHVSAFDARVRVVTSDEPKVQFQVQYERPGDSSAALPISSSKTGNVVELTVKGDWHEWLGSYFGKYRGEIEVRMPKDADLQVATSNGAVEITSLNGSISAHTSNGDMVLKQLKGKLLAHTSNGSIRAEGLDGNCEFATSNGSIEVKGRLDAMDVSSSNGHIAVHAEPGSRILTAWNIGTSNSAIDLFLPTDVGADLDANTSNGHIQLDLPMNTQGSQSRTHLHGALNGGGQQLAVHTSNDNIRISEFKDGAGSQSP